MFQLLIERNFGSLNVAQFVTVFNDNALKQSFLLITVVKATEQEGAGYEEQALATILFSIPFLLLSGFAGRFTDWMSKRKVIVGAKFSEVLIMVLAMFGFAAEEPFFVGVFPYGVTVEPRHILLVSLLFLAAQSAFFSPAKYGILPEILPREKLSPANGLLQTTSYLAILIGTAFAGYMLGLLEGRRGWIGLGLTVLAVIGWLFSMILDHREPADPEKPLFSGWPLVDELSSIAWIVRRRFLFASMVGYAFVWMVGTVLLFNINVYAIDTLELGTGSTSLLVVLLSIGLAGGCLLAGLLSGERIEPGLVPLGAFGMGMAFLLFLLRPASLVSTASILVVAGVFGGLFLIPLQTLLQELPEENRKGEALGIANVITFLGVIVSSLLYMVAVGWFEISPSNLMVLLGGLTIGAGVFIVCFVPRFLFRFLLFVASYSVVRTQVQGHELIPGKGGVLIQGTDTSRSAPLFIDYAVDRPVHFIRFQRSVLDETPSYLMTFLHITDVDVDTDTDVKQAMETVRSELAEGSVVCVLSETEMEERADASLTQELDRSGCGEWTEIGVRVDGIERSVFGRKEKGEQTTASQIPADVSVHFYTDDHKEVANG